MQDRLELRVHAIIREATDAITIVLTPITEQEVLYKAGQFLTFIFNREGKEVRRSYSLCSAPGIDKHLAVTVKRIPNGEISRYLLDHLQAGDTLQALYPAGRFTITTSPTHMRDIFLIGAGSGITPLFSILKTLLKEEPQSKVVLINSNKSTRDAFYLKEINQLEIEYNKQFSSFHLFSQPEEGGLRTRLTIDLLEKLVKENIRHNQQDALFYLCGPVAFMRMAKITLLYMGINEDQIFKETFVTGTLPHYASMVPADTPARTVSVKWGSRQHNLRVPPEQSILKAAKEAGFELPYSCEAGMCSTCIAKTKPGAVALSHNEVLTEKEIKAGWILTCTAHPLQDEIEVEVPAKKG